MAALHIQHNALLVGALSYARMPTAGITNGGGGAWEHGQPTAIDDDGDTGGGDDRNDADGDNDMMSIKMTRTMILVMEMATGEARKQRGSYDGYGHDVG